NCAFLNNCSRRSVSGALGAHLAGQCHASHREAATASSFDGQFHIHRALFLSERTAQLGKRNILQLPNALSGDSTFLAYLLERLGLSAVQAETLEDDLLFAIVQNVQQPANLVTKIFVTQQLKRRLRLLVANDFAELGRIVVADRRVK